MIEAYEWKKGAPRPSLVGSNGILAVLEAPPTGGPQIGDTIFLSGRLVGDASSLGVPYQVLERIFSWTPEGEDHKWSKMWISVRRIEWSEYES